ncbi:MAG: GH39 family glycosyl hydrolase [Candidatus Brocadiia bacterium]
MHTRPFAIVVLAACALLGLACARPGEGAAEDEEHDVLLVDLARRGALHVHRGRQFHQATEVVAADGGRARKLTWAEGARRLLETMCRQRPTLYAFHEGLTVAMALDARGLPGLEGVAVRAVDADGETFQWSGDAGPASEGWQEVRVRLDPARHQGSWGGGERGRGTLDLPVRFLGLAFMAPEGLEGPGHVLVRGLWRNPFDPEIAERERRLEKLTVDLETGLPLAIVRKGEEEAARLAVANAGEKALTLDLAASLEGYDGHTVAWRRPGLGVPAGGRATVPLGARLDRFGWWRLEVTLADPQVGTSRRALATSLAYFQPAGTRAEHRESFLYGIGGALKDERTALAAALVGADVVRDGRSWLDIQPAPDQYRWEKMDAMVRRAQAHGLVHQYLLTYCPAWAARPAYAARHEARRGWSPINQTPPRLEAWRAWVRTVARRYRGRIRQWEVWNEPDLEGFYKGTTDEYIELLRVAYRELKAVDPRNQVMSGGFATVLPHGGKHLNPRLHERVIREAQDAFDIHTHHQHGTFEQFARAVDGPLAEIREALEAPRPLYFNETAIGSEHGRKVQARTLVKKLVFARARGAMAYSWFLMRGGNPHTDGFGMLDWRSDEPRPVLCAFNELVKLLRDKPAVDQVARGDGQWLFRAPRDGETVLVGWRESGGVEGQALLVRVPPGAEAHRLDLMGNPSPVELAEGVFAWTLGPAPVYVRVRGGAPRVGGSPVRLEGRAAGLPGERLRLEAVLRNPLAREARFALTWQALGGKPTEHAVAVEPDGTARQAFQVVVPDAPGDQPHRAALAYAIEGTPFAGQLSVPLRVARLVPAAPFERREPDFVLRERADVVNRNENDPARQHMVWQGPADLSARAWVGRDADALRVRVLVRDDAHVQPHAAGRMWKADCVQLGIQVPGQEGYWEIGLARGEGGRPLVATWLRPAGRPDPSGRVDLATAPLEGGLIYDAAIPYAALGLSEETVRRRAIGFSFIVNDDDGHGREGWLQASPGIGEAKDPAQFPLLQLE